MLFFPKDYGDGKTVDISDDPPTFPFRGEKNNFDFTYFNVKYFQNFEQRVKDLMDIGIEADVILFHFYDFGHWGIDTGMSTEDDLFYLKYLIARLAAFRNVWWSLANEYDLYADRASSTIRYVPNRKEWDKIGRFIQDNDPHDHLRSVHNFPAGKVYPNRDWLSHVSYQNSNTYSLLLQLKESFDKPVINDEYQYEGNIPMAWGNASPEIEVYRHWTAVMAGGYATHGETYNRGDPTQIFWSNGGDLTGVSPPKLRFMKEILEICPFQEMKPFVERSEGINMFCLNKDEEIYLYFITPSFKDKDHIFIGDSAYSDRMYQITIFDAWNCKKIAALTRKTGYNSFDLPDWAVLKVERS